MELKALQRNAIERVDVIKITVELISAKDVSRNRVLAQATIANDGEGTDSRANYTASFKDAKGKVMRSSHVEFWPRKQRHVWMLIGALMRTAGYANYHDSHGS